MILQSISLENFRNYENIRLDFSEGTNIFYGDNAQGKSNLLEAIYLAVTNKSYRGAKDGDLILFEKEEAHVSFKMKKNELPYQIDIHLKKDKGKTFAVNQAAVPKVTDFIGLVNGILFSPEDLQIVKDGPQERRKFLDAEISLTDRIYLAAYIQYKKALEMRNHLLKDAAYYPTLLDTLESWDETLSIYGREMIKKRRLFLKSLSSYAYTIHRDLTGGKEKLKIDYEPSVSEENFLWELKKAREKDLAQKTTTVGPHRDDISFLIENTDTGKEIDVREFGSQGQKRTAALSLKLAEIQHVKEKTGEEPILLLDDVLSELDANRQQYLIQSIKDTQTFLTCTGLDDFVKNHFEDAKVYKVTNGVITNG